VKKLLLLRVLLNSIESVYPNSKPIYLSDYNEKHRSLQYERANNYNHIFDLNDFS